MRRKREGMRRGRDEERTKREKWREIRRQGR